MGTEVWNEEDELYTPEQLREYASQIAKLRRRVLCMEEGGASAISEQYFLLALNALEAGERFMTLAAIEQSREIATIRLRAK